MRLKEEAIAGPNFDNLRPLAPAESMLRRIGSKGDM
jgi:hypothetical protein